MMIDFLRYRIKYYAAEGCRYEAVLTEQPRYAANTIVLAMIYARQISWATRTFNTHLYAHVATMPAAIIIIYYRGAAY